MGSILKASSMRLGYFIIVFCKSQHLSLIHIDAADDLLCVDLGGRRIIKKKKKKKKNKKKTKKNKNKKTQTTKTTTIDNKQKKKKKKIKKHTN